MNNQLVTHNQGPKRKRAISEQWTHDAKVSYSHQWLVRKLPQSDFEHRSSKRCFGVPVIRVRKACKFGQNLPENAIDSPIQHTNNDIVE